MSLSPARPSWFQIKLQLCPVLRIPNFIQLPPGREVQSILRNLLSPGQMYFTSTNNIIWVLQFCLLSFFESVNYFEPFSLFKILRTHHYKSFTTLNLCKPSTSLKVNWAMAKKLTQIVPKKDPKMTKLPIPRKYPSASNTTTMKIMPGKNLLLGEANHPESSLRDCTWDRKKIVGRVNLVRMYEIPGSCLAVNEIYPVVMQNCANLRTNYQTDH